MRPIDPLPQCPVIDGCSPPSICDISVEEYLCSVRALLPPGELWQRSIEAQDKLISGCQTLPTVVRTSDCDLPEIPEVPESGGDCSENILHQGSVLVGLIDSVSRSQYDIFCYLCSLAKELDPCSAEATLDYKFQALGLETCTNYDICDACFRTMPYELERAVKRIVLCLAEKVSYGVVVNQDFLNDVLGIFGYRAEFISIGDFNCETSVNLYICEPPSRTPKRLNASGVAPFSRRGFNAFPFDCEPDCEPKTRCWEIPSKVRSTSYQPADTTDCFIFFDCDEEPCWDRSPEFGLRLCRMNATVQVEGCLTPVVAQLPTELTERLFRPGCTELNRPLNENLLLGVALCLVEKFVPENSRRFIEADCCPVCE